jgi:hypothetical protein
MSAADPDVIGRADSQGGPIARQVVIEGRRQALGTIMQALPVVGCGIGGGVRGFRLFLRGACHD